ncbi:hypothetical protein HDV05_008637 [Chytridiales sp. JEL 0842]|nr:hypothetical protein HDV05_008637 [Chytridiales sp. JEL 0842]
MSNNGSRSYYDPPPQHMYTHSLHEVKMGAMMGGSYPSAPRSKAVVYLSLKGQRFCLTSRILSNLPDSVMALFPSEWYMKLQKPTSLLHHPECYIFRTRPRANAWNDNNSASKSALPGRALSPQTTAINKVNDVSPEVLPKDNQIPKQLVSPPPESDDDISSSPLPLSVKDAPLLPPATESNDPVAPSTSTSLNASSTPEHTDVKPESRIEAKSNSALPHTHDVTEDTSESEAGSSDYDDELAEHELDYDLYGHETYPSDTNYDSHCDCGGIPCADDFDPEDELLGLELIDENCFISMDFDPPMFRYLVAEVRGVLMENERRIAEIKLANQRNHDLMALGGHQRHNSAFKAVQQNKATEASIMGKISNLFGMSHAGHGTDPSQQQNQHSQPHEDNQMESCQDSSATQALPAEPLLDPIETLLVLREEIEFFVLPPPPPNTLLSPEPLYPLSINTKRDTTSEKDLPFIPTGPATHGLLPSPSSNETSPRQTIMAKILPRMKISNPFRKVGVGCLSKEDERSEEEVYIAEKEVVSKESSETIVNEKAEVAPTPIPKDEDANLDMRRDELAPAEQAEEKKETDGHDGESDSWPSMAEEIFEADRTTVVDPYENPTNPLKLFCRDVLSQHVAVAENLGILARQVPPEVEDVLPTPRSMSPSLFHHNAPKSPQSKLQSHRTTSNMSLKLLSKLQFNSKHSKEEVFIHDTLEHTHLLKAIKAYSDFDTTAQWGFRQVGDKKARLVSMSVFAGKMYPDKLEDDPPERHSLFQSLSKLAHPDTSESTKLDHAHQNEERQSSSTPSPASADDEELTHSPITQVEDTHSAEAVSAGFSMEKLTHHLMMRRPVRKCWWELMTINNVDLKAIEEKYKHLPPSSIMVDPSATPQQSSEMKVSFVSTSEQLNSKDLPPLPNADIAPAAEPASVDLGTSPSPKPPSSEPYSPTETQASKTWKSKLRKSVSTKLGSTVSSFLSSKTSNSSTPPTQASTTAPSLEPMSTISEKLTVDTSADALVEKPVPQPPVDLKVWIRRVWLIEFVNVH